MGQIEQESGCRPDVQAFDGGMGLGQFMPETADWIQRKEKALQDITLRPAPYDPRWSIRALILYDRWLYENVDCRDWHYAYRAYNGGIGILNQEIRRAESCGYAAVDAACKRRTVQLKHGTLSLCDVNISYPIKVKRTGEKYRRIP